jgi:hypothetical protein
MLIWRNCQAVYFCPKGWTGFVRRELICPAGTNLWESVAAIAVRSLSPFFTGRGSG